MTLFVIRASDKFEIGDRVVASPTCPHSLSARTGVVTAFGRKPWLVRVRVDGLTRKRGDKGGIPHTPATYHMDFWLKADG